jgi:hypothetical protein
MSVQALVRWVAAGLAALVVSAMPMAASAQQPSKSSMALANEILDIKGSLEKSKATLLQMNPNLFKDVDAIGNDLRKEFAPRLAVLREEIAKIYATRFTEQEMKDTIAFYKSPLGKKILTEEPNFVDRSMAAAQDWAVKLNDEVLQRFRAELRKRGHPF